MTEPITKERIGQIKGRVNQWASLWRRVYDGEDVNQSNYVLVDLLALLALIESSGEKVEYKLRPEVAAFAMLMEEELRKHDDRPGWKDCSPGWLMDRLHQELKELSSALNHDIAEAVPREAADVANFAMMIADVSGGLKPAPPTPPANMIGWLDKTVKKLTDEGIVPEEDLMVATEIRNLILQPKATVTSIELASIIHDFNMGYEQVAFNRLRDIGVVVTEEEGK